MAVEIDNVEGAGSHAEPQGRDEIFWTELEFRRLGNIVAEMIQAARYVGDSDAAHAERLLLRTRIDAMRRKSLRILCRAELFANSGQGEWPGLDRTLTEPVSLADEYVRTVSNYDAVLADEEELAQNALKEDVDIGGLRAESRAAAASEPKILLGAESSRGSMNDGAVEDVHEGRQLLPAQHEDISYRDALAREAATEKPSGGDRDELLGGSLRHRRDAGKVGPKFVTSAFSKEDEELMKRHQPVEDQLTNDLIELVGRLKENVTEINTKIRKDNQVVDATDDAIEKNLSGVSKQRGNLSAYTRSTSMSWWTIWIILFVVVIVFVLLVILMRIPV